ncbi:hypothetical protein ACEPAF_4719 [Sanghuangporus sanghuang]
MFQPLLLALSLVPFVVAQDSNVALDIEAIQAHFSNAGLVPDLLTTFTPVAAMSVSFDGVGVIQPGQALSIDQVASQPTVSIATPNSSVSLGDTFTLTMVDADIVGTDESAGQTRHWLVNNASLSDASGNNRTVTNSSATAITDYAGPGPASGSGAHRYVILLYTQPSNFSPPADLSSPNTGVATFILADYVSTSGLQGPVAGTYFTVEEGTASVSVSSTSAVVTSTLSVPSSASATGSATGSAAASTETSGAIGSGQYKNSATVILIGALAAFAFS